MFSKSKLSLGMKFLSMQACITLVGLCTCIVFVHFIMSASTEEKLNEQLMQTNTILERSFNIFVNQIISYTQTSLDILKFELEATHGKEQKNSYRIDLNDKVQVGAELAPNLFYNNHSLANNIEFIDTFSTLTKGVGTIFVRNNDDDFVRITTSLTDTSGSRMIGTKLGKNHPAYKIIMDYKTFYGKVKLFGRYYMSAYAPIIDSANKIVGILFVASALDNQYAILREQLGTLPIGKNGNILVIDKENDSFIVGDDNKPSTLPYFNNLLENGFFTYTEDEKKYQVFSKYNDALDLYILSKALIEDFTKSDNRVKQLIMLGIFIIFSILIIVSLLMVRHLILSRLKNVFNTIIGFLEYINHDKKESPPFMKIKANDEIGLLIEKLNKSMQRVQQRTNRR